MTPRHDLRVLAIADSDSRLKWAMGVGRSMGGSLRTASIDTGMVPSARQRNELGLDGSHLVVAPSDLAEDSLLTEHDVVVACCVGSLLHRLRAATVSVSATRDRRPVLVTGYAGVVYQGHLEGILWRSGFDVIVVNSQADFRWASGYFGALELSTDSLLVGSWSSTNSSGRERQWPPRSVVFAAQPDVPRMETDRAALLSSITDYAANFPDRSVVIKLRARPKEVTTHPEPFNMEQLARSLWSDEIPSNLEFRYGRMDEVLPDADLLLTVSSTAAFEAWEMGVPVGILTDVGLGEALGNHHFIGSGAFVTIQDLLDDQLPVVDQAWLSEHGVGGSSSAVVDRVVALHQRQAELGFPLKFPTAFHRPATTPVLVERLKSSPSGAGSRSKRRTRAVVRRVLGSRVRQVVRRLTHWAQG